MDTPTSSIGTTVVRLGFGGIAVGVLGSVGPIILEVLVLGGAVAAGFMIGVMTYGALRRNGARFVLWGRETSLEFGDSAFARARAGPPGVGPNDGEVGSDDSYLQLALLGPGSMPMQSCRTSRGDASLSASA